MQSLHSLDSVAAVVLDTVRSNHRTCFVEADKFSSRLFLCFRWKIIGFHMCALGNLLLCFLLA